jgi:hypothetical protein
MTCLHEDVPNPYENMPQFPVTPSFKKLLYNGIYWTQQLLAGAA